MKKLLILRHGKSSWEDPKLRDFERPLINKGKMRTQLIADYIIRHEIVPEYIISSPAVRAFETAKIAAMNFGFSPDFIQQNADLYFVNVEKYFEAAFLIPDEISRAMLVGHNPMITDFCNKFLKKPIDNLPTSGLCVVAFNTEHWTDIAKAECNVEHLVFPKKLEKE